MHLKLVLCGILCSFHGTPSFGARILGIVPTPSYSHQIVFHQLWRDLSLKGHQLTVLTTDPINDPLLTNLTEINLHFAYEIWNRFNMFGMTSDLSITELFSKGLALSNELIDKQLEHPQVKELIKNETEHFDLLLVEGLLPVMFAFSERFKCPFIQVTSLDAPAYSHYIVGNPAHPVLTPDFMLPFSGQLTFFERLISTLYFLYVMYVNNSIYYEAQQSMIEKHFGHDYPSITDIRNNVSMMFINTNSIFHRTRPFLPSVVQIGGGTHFQRSKPLPKELQTTLDNAKQGFIYFSLGTNVKSKDFSEESRSILLQAFAEIPYIVLWKFELEDLPDKPDNVIISKWFPQQDILRHPNIKLFITQGGLQSMEEAIYNHIPIVGIPFIGDQPMNVQRMVDNGVGLFVDSKSLDKISFKKTVLEVINNPIYRNRIRELAVLAQDQPMTGLERAVWWTEYVIRHKGAKHFKSPAMDLPLYQYLLLDVIGFCLLVLSVSVFILLQVGKLLFKIGKYVKPKEKMQ